MLTLSTKNWYVSTVSTFSTYKFFVGCGCTKTLFKKLIWSLRENTSIFFYYQKLEKNLLDKKIVFDCARPMFWLSGQKMVMF